MIVHLSEPERQVVLGALDTMGVELARRGHTWTDGERAIYEQAIALLEGRRGEAPAAGFEDDDDDGAGEAWKKEKPAS